MAPETVEKKMERLERRVTRLEELPGRVDALTSQIVQLRGEMRSEFSAVRGEMQDLAGRLGGRIDQTRTEMRVLHEELIAKLALLREWQEAQPRTHSRQRKS